METHDRLHALDGLRAFALFLGIYFHASLSFMPGVEQWVVTDTSTSGAIWIVSGFSHLFRMSLFFFIAGYFARLVYHRKGFVYFVRDRAKRIALPLVMFLPVMWPLLGLIWEWGAQESHRTLIEPPPLSVQLPADALVVSLLLAPAVQRGARRADIVRASARSVGAHQAVCR